MDMALLSTEVLAAIGVAVVVVIVSLIFLARPRGKEADLVSQLKSARAEIRDLLDTINCGAPRIATQKAHVVAAVGYKCGSSVRLPPLLKGFLCHV